MEEVIHFAISGTTACGKGIYGGTLRVDDGDMASDCSPLYLHHTVFREDVTCTGCKGSTTFKSYKEEEE